MEHLFSYGDRPVLAVVNKPPDIDSESIELYFKIFLKFETEILFHCNIVGLFIRPFQNEAWYASLLLTALMLVMVLTPFLWNADYDSTDSSMITQVK